VKKGRGQHGDEKERSREWPHVSDKGSRDDRPREERPHEDRPRDERRAHTDRMSEDEDRSGR